MRNSKFNDAIYWIAENDDNDWIDDSNGIPSVTACMVADVFNVSIDVVVTSIKRAIKKLETKHLPRYKVKHNKKVYFVVYNEAGDDVVCIETRLGHKLNLNKPLARDIMADQIVYGLDGKPG